MGIDAIYYIYIAASVGAAASAISTARGIEETEDLRQQAIRNEIRSAEIQAEQEEIDRRRELAFANSEAIVNAGNLDPFGSPSLLAIRRSNLVQTEKQVRNIKINLSLAKAQGSNSILASQIRSHTARTTGILDAASSLLGAAAVGSKLLPGKPPVTPKPKGGSPTGPTGPGRS
jgi:hypothetical protein